MTLTLAEITQQVRNSSIEDLLKHNDSYFEFVHQAMESGREILVDVDKESCAMAITIMQSYAVADVLEEGNLSLNEMKFLMSPKFTSIVATVFRMSVGIAAMEELK